MNKKKMKKTCQQIARSRLQPDCLLVSSDAIVISDEQKPDDNLGLASLLRRALNKLSNSREYNGIVEDIHTFVNLFNERTPECKLCLGLQAILYNAEKQRARGWK
jgi:hypothetical protein